VKYLFILIFVLSACSSVDDIPDNPEQLYEQAERYIKSDKLQIALERLRVLRNKFPYSRFSQVAQLRIADVYFLQAAFAEAAASYELFRELHPKHEKAPYALFRAGESYFRATPSTIARDLTYGHKSIEALSSYLKLHPSGEHSDDAQKLLVQMRDRLAEKELSIANFYFKKRFYGAAERRYKKILDLYPESRVAKNAGERIKRIESINP